MLLIGQLDSPYVRRVAVSLHMLGIAFERNPLSVFGNAEEVRRLNPLGRVPVLVLDSGERLADSAAILDHLDEIAGPTRALLPRAGEARRRALQLVALATGANDKAMSVSYERLQRPAEKVHEPWLARLETQLDATLASLEALPQSPWLMGERPLQPDITLGCTLSYLRLALPGKVAAGRYPALDRLSARCEALPAFAATRPGADERPRGIGPAPA
jgi:glutathione S-transferase